MLNKKHKQAQATKWLIIIILVAVVVVLAVTTLRKSGKTASNFQSCKDAGGAILESYPEQCLLNGKTFMNEAQSVENGSDEYIGLAEPAALDKASTENKTARVVERDGEPMAITMDYMPGRLNLYVKDGRIYKVQVEGQENQ